MILIGWVNLSETDSDATPIGKAHNAMGSIQLGSVDLDIRKKVTGLFNSDGMRSCWA